MKQKNTVKKHVKEERKEKRRYENRREDEDEEAALDSALNLGIMSLPRGCPHVAWEITRSREKPTSNQFICKNHKLRKHVSISTEDPMCAKIFADLCLFAEPSRALAAETCSPLKYMGKGEYTKN